MIELGKFQTLYVRKIVSCGVYVAESAATSTKMVLLPKKHVPSNVKVGDSVHVFIYRDSEDRLIATTYKPKITIGQIAELTVVHIDKNGVFLDMGLDRDLFLPFAQQTKALYVGDSALVAMYIDKSGRLCATMRLFDYLRTDSPYQVGEKTIGTVYLVHNELGIFIAVDDQYAGMIYRKNTCDIPAVGDRIDVIIQKIRPDGKLVLSNRLAPKLQIASQAEELCAWLSRNNGVIPFNDKADPMVIRNAFNMSKADFKRAIGRLLKEGKVVIKENSIETVCD